jgi:hypothetical protein
LPRKQQIRVHRDPGPDAGSNFNDRRQI